jgi:hypothetical protein
VLGQGQDGATGTAGEEGSARRLLCRSRGKWGRRWGCGEGPVWSGVGARWRSRGILGGRQ